MTAGSAFDAALTDVLSEVASSPGCRVLAPAGVPPLPAGLVMPAELRQFYQRCGEMILFEDADFPWQVSGPQELVPASPRLLTAELAEQIAAEDPSELTVGCYVIAEGAKGAATGPHIVIDLHPDRAGRCYEVFWDTYGLAGDMPVVAHGVVELLRRLLSNNGAYANLPGPHYGDAYQ